MRQTEEFRIQAQCAQWLWNTYPECRKCFILVDNNSSSTIAALQKRAMGMVKGAADTFFYWKKHLYFMEFKTPIGKQSQAQMDFQNVANIHAHKYLIIRSFEEFKEIIESILRYQIWP